jgi:hypothetical protein
MAAGPRPARKWFGLGLFGYSLGNLFTQQDRPNVAWIAYLAGAAGHALGLASFRRPERVLEATLREAVPSVGAGMVMAGVVAAISQE